MPETKAVNNIIPTITTNILKSKGAKAIFSPVKVLKLGRRNLAKNNANRNAKNTMINVSPKNCFCMEIFRAPTTLRTAISFSLVFVLAIARLMKFIQAMPNINSAMMEKTTTM